MGFNCNSFVVVKISVQMNSRHFFSFTGIPKIYNSISGYANFSFKFLSVQIEHVSRLHYKVVSNLFGKPMQTYRFVCLFLEHLRSSVVVS